MCDTNLLTSIASAIFFFCSDAAVKQILLQMNERRREENSFVIEDLDQTHLLIKADEEESMRQELEAEVRFFLLSLQSPEVIISISVVGEEYIQHGAVVMKEVS